MHEDEVRQRCEQFVQGLGVPCFIVFGWQKETPANPSGDDGQTSGQNPGQQFGMVSSYHQMPVQAVIKGMSWALNDIVNKSM